MTLVPSTRSRLSDGTATTLARTGSSTLSYLYGVTQHWNAGGGNDGPQVVAVDPSTGKVVYHSLTNYGLVLAGNGAWGIYAPGFLLGGPLVPIYTGVTQQVSYASYSPDLSQSASYVVTIPSQYPVNGAPADFDTFVWQGRPVVIFADSNSVRGVNFMWLDTQQVFLTIDYTGSDPDWESDPEAFTLVGDYVYYTRDGPRVTRVNLSNGACTWPISLLENPLYSETETAGLDVDLSGVASDGTYIYAFGYNESYQRTGQSWYDRNVLMVYRAPLASTGQWERIFEYFHYGFESCFSGSGVIIDGVYYMAATKAPYVAALNLTTLDFWPNVLNDTSLASPIGLVSGAGSVVTPRSLATVGTTDPPRSRLV